MSQTVPTATLGFIYPQSLQHLATTSDEKNWKPETSRVGQSTAFFCLSDSPEPQRETAAQSQLLDARSLLRLYGGEVR